MWYPERIPEGMAEPLWSDWCKRHRWLERRLRVVSAVHSMVWSMVHYLASGSAEAVMLSVDDDGLDRPS
jgi:hypothetical protein